MLNNAHSEALECVEQWQPMNLPASLFIDPGDDYYPESLFGPGRLDVPNEVHVYSYLNGAARYYYLPGFLRLAIETGDEAFDLVMDLLTDLTEPNMLVSEDRYSMWSLLMESTAGEKACIAQCLPLLEKLAGNDLEPTEEEDLRNRRAKIWQTPLL